MERAKSWVEPDNEAGHDNHRYYKVMYIDGNAFPLSALSPPPSLLPSSLPHHPHCIHTLHIKNYQSTFYQTTSKDDDDEEEESQESLSYYPINASLPHRNYPILPRSTPLSPNSYQSSPWLKTTPGRSFPSPSMQVMQS